MNQIFKSIPWNILFVIFSAGIITFLFFWFSKVFNSVKIKNEPLKQLICFFILFLVFIIAIVATAFAGAIIYDILKLII